MPFATTWMDLEMIILSKSDDITYMWNLNCETSEFIYRTETDSQTENRFVVAKGEEGEGWVDWEFGISRSKLLHSEWINKVLLHSKGNNIQFPTINHNRKEYEKEHIYRCKSLFYTVEINTTLCDTSETEGPGATPTMCSRQDLEQSLPLRGEGYYHLYRELR